MSEEVNLALDHERDLLHKIGSRLTGLEDEIGAIISVHQEIEPLLEKAGEIIEETEDKIERAENAAGFGAEAESGKVKGHRKHAENSNERGNIEGVHGSARKENERRERVKEEVQIYAKEARVIKNNIGRLEDLTEEISDATEEQLKEINRVSELEGIIEEMDDKMAELDRKVGEAYEESH